MKRSILLLSLILIATTLTGQEVPRARDLGIPLDGTPGQYNAITDVKGVLVGHSTVIKGEGKNAIRTGVTAILPNKKLDDYDASIFIFNGDGEISGATFVEEFGYLRSPIMLTGTGSNGTVYTSVIKWSIDSLEKPIYIPVVADTWDAYLSNFKLFPLKEEHVYEALNSATSGKVPEGNVGGGTGMICYDFKAGIGTASRILSREDGGFTIGVLVQTNHGYREELTVAGVPVGKQLKDRLPVLKNEEDGDGSIIIVIATDAPVSTQVLKGMAKRATFGLARTGSMGSPYSGDIIIAFSTQRTEWSKTSPYKRINGEYLDQYESEPIYKAVIQSTEEAIINSIIAGKTMTGINGSKVFSISHARLIEIMKKYNRMKYN